MVTLRPWLYKVWVVVSITFYANPPTPKKQHACQKPNNIDGHIREGMFYCDKSAWTKYLTTRSFGTSMHWTV